MLTEAWRMSIGRLRRARLWSRWKLGLPPSSRATTSPSSTRRSKGSAATARRISGKLVAQSLPLRVRRRGSPLVRAARIRYPSSLGSNSQPLREKARSAVSASMGLSAFTSTARRGAPSRTSSRRMTSPRSPPSPSSSTVRPESTDSGASSSGSFVAQASRSLMRSQSFSDFLIFTRVHVPRSL